MVTISRRSTWAICFTALLGACTAKQSQPVSQRNQGDDFIVALPKTSTELSEEGIKSMEKQNIQFHKLDNGLEVFMIEKKNIPMVTVLLGVRNGSFAESQENNGLAHLYEHMFFKANEKIPSQPLFLKALDEMGVELGPNMNAYTSTESVRYFFTIQSQYLQRGLQFMADAVITPKFLQSELEKERKVVIGEFDRFESSPSDVFFQRSLMGRLFPDHFIRKNVIGSRPVIEGATQEQMHEIKNRYYIPNNSALFIVGDFEKTETKKWIMNSFGKWKKGPDPFVFYPVPEHPPLKQTIQFSELGPVQTTHLVLGMHGPKLTKDNASAIGLDLISIMLGLEASKFQKELVQSGLASSASFFSWSQRYTSPHFFTLETSPDRAQAAYDKLIELIQEIQKGGFFTEEELSIAKTAVEVSSAYDRESGQRFALHLASLWSSTGNLDFYLNYVDTVKNMSLKNIDAVVQQYIRGQKLVTGALVPQKSQTLAFREISQ